MKLKVYGAIALAIVCVLAVLGVVHAASPPFATLTWIAPTTNTDGSTITAPITYNVYQGASSTSLAKVATALSGSSDTITGLSPGTTAYFAVTSVVNGVESAQSAVVSLAVPFPTPGAPTGITCTMQLVSQAPTTITITCQ